MRKDWFVQQNRDLVGNYFEKLSAAVFGGEVQENGRNNSETGAPDIINYDDNQAYEVKSTTRGDWVKIDPRQVEHYCALTQQEFPLDHPEVYYFIWSFQRDREIPLEMDGLESFLAERHKAALALSLDIISAGLGYWPRSGSKGWPEYAGITGPTRRTFFRDPVKALRDLNLDADDFTIVEKNFRKAKYLGLKTSGFRVMAVYNKNLNGLSALI